MALAPFRQKMSFSGLFSKGTLVKMKAKGGLLPLPHPLKGMQVSSGANVGTGFPFVKKLIILNKDGPSTPTPRTPAARAIGTLSKVPNVVGKLGPGVEGGGPLIFIIKSPFNAKISITGDGSPTPLKGKESASNKRGITGSAGCFLSGPKKTISAASKGAGMGMYPFVKKSPLLVASPMGGIESFGSRGGVSGGAFMAKIGITGGGSPMPLKGEESTSSVDNKHSITDSGGLFLLGPKKIISVASGGINEKASFLPPEGVLGKDLPLSLKAPLSSFKGDDDVSKQPGNDSVSLTTVNESIGPLTMLPFSSPATPLKGAEVFASIVGVKAPNMTEPLKTYSFLESLSKGKRFGKMKAKDSGNIIMPTKGSFVESRGMGNLGGTMKAKSNGVSSTLMNKFFLG
jgi:hypothetical protein